MARIVTSAPFLLGTLAALAVTLAAISAQAAWQTPGTPTDDLGTAAAPPPGITATINTAYFKITPEDVAKAVAEQLRLQAVEQKAEVSLTAGTPGILHSADHPLKVTIHALQIDATAKRWQAQAYILSNGQTETVKPVSGTYSALIDVPVLSRQLGRADVIEAKDLVIKSFSERQLRKDAITDSKQLIGLSPRMTISAERPIRATEVSSPVLVKRGQAVELTYTNPYMSLKATGTALGDGAKGDMVRVKNDKSEKAVSGRVTGNGTVEVNSVQATIAPSAPAPAPAALAPASATPAPQPTTPQPTPSPAH